jgi:hypothetical protein
MRDYARQHLAGSGEEVTHRSRHAHALAELAERADAAITDHDACAPMLAEHDNLREAIAWLLANEPVRAVEMAVWVSRAASFSTWRLETLRWLESARRSKAAWCRAAARLYARAPDADEPRPRARRM